MLGFWPVVQQLLIALVATALGAILVRTYKTLRTRGGATHRPSHVADTASASRSSLIGFGVAVLAGLAWGIENVITTYTVREYPNSSFEISFLQYLMAGFALFLVAMIANKQNGIDLSACKRMLMRPSSYLAALSKGLNTYFWILSAAFVTAGYAATLENLHVLWTLLIVSFFFARRTPTEWFASTIILVVGVTLLTGVYDPASLETLGVRGLVLGILSGLAFSIFTMAWSRSQDPDANFATRTLELSIFMLLSGILIYPAQFLFRTYFLEIPNQSYFASLPIRHILLQSLNGFVGLGIAYLLINESLRRLKDYGDFSVLLVGLGLSYSVLFTYIGELIMFGIEISILQWIGVVLFSVGFSSVRYNIEKYQHSPK